MNNFEDNLKCISKKKIDVPESYKNSVKEALNYISNMDKITNIKKNRFSGLIKKIAVVLIIGTIGVTGYAKISGNIDFKKLDLNKLSQNFDENKVSIDQTIENDYFIFSLKNIARDSAYIILEYKLNLKEKAISELGEITYNEPFGYNFGLFNKIILNDDVNPFVINYMSKESDTEYSYYQIINIMTYENENQDIKIWFDSLWKDSYLNELVPINQMIEISTKIDNFENDFEKIEKKLEDGSTLTLDKIVNTNFQTFIRMNRVLDDVTIKEYSKRIFENFKTFIITDNNDNLIPHTTYTSDVIGKTRFFNKESGEYIDETDLYNMKKTPKLRIEEDYVILLDDISSIKDIRIYPIKTRLYNDRTNEEKEYYNKAIWYPLVEGEKIYTAKSNLGGTLEINKITIDDKNIIFDYNKIGIVENVNYVLIRQNNGVMNYVYPLKQDKTNSGKIIFSRDQNGLAGLNLSSKGCSTMLQDLKDLEFTLLFGNVVEFEGSVYESSIPEEKNQKIEIKNINKVNTNTKTVKIKYNSQELKYKLDYDNDDNILRFNGYLDLLTYRIDGKTKFVIPKNYKKSTELINVIKEHLDYKNIEYTIIDE